MFTLSSDKDQRKQETGYRIRDGVRGGGGGVVPRGLFPGWYTCPPLLPRIQRHSAPAVNGMIDRCKNITSFAGGKNGKNHARFHSSVRICLH